MRWLPRLNVRFLVALVVVVLGLGAAAYGVRRQLIRRGIDGLVTRAERAAEAGDAATAEAMLRQYLAFRPTDAEALARLAILLADNARTPRRRMAAQQALEDAIRRSPDRDDLRRRDIDLAMRPDLRQYGDAIAHLDALLAAKPDDPELLRLKARCLEGDRKDTDAVALLRRLVEGEPRDADSHARLAGLLRFRLDRPGEADQVMDRLVEQDPDDSRAYLERARYRQASRLEGADSDVAEALELAPRDPEVLLAAAAIALGGDDIEAARRHAGEAVEQAPREAGAYRMLAAVESRAGRPGIAAEVLACGIDAIGPGEGPSGSSLDLRWYRALALIEAGDPAGAREVVTGLRDDEEMAPAALDYLEARMLVDERRWAEAARLATRARDSFAAQPERVALLKEVELMLARCWMALGDLDRALAASRRAVEADPGSTPARMGMAGTLLALGRDDEALAAFRTVRPPTPEALAAVARLLLATNLRRPAAQRDWAEFRRALDDARRAAADPADLATLQARMETAQGQRDRALATLRRAVADKPDRVDVWVTLALLSEQDGKPGGGLPVVEEAASQLGDGVEARLVRVGYWAGRGTEEARAPLAALAGELDALDGEPRARLAAALADAFARIGAPKEAAACWKIVAEAQPGELAPAYRWFQALLAAGPGDDRGVAIRQILDRLRAIEGDDGTLWRLAEATYLAAGTAEHDRDRRLAQARSRLAEVLRRRPQWGLAVLEDARLAELERKPDEAIASYLRAIELGETSLAVARRATELLYARGRYIEADRLLQQVRSQATPADDSALARLEAQLSALNQDPARASTLARAAVSAESKDPRDLMWLGRIEVAAGRVAEAERAIRRAVMVGGDDPDPRVMLVELLAVNGRQADLEAELKEAELALAGPERVLDLARCYEWAGRFPRAEELARAALERVARDAKALVILARVELKTGRPTEAEAHLRQVIELHGARSDEGAAASRLLVTLLATRGDEAGAQEALRMVGAEGAGAPAGDGPTVADPRTRARVLAARFSRERQREAIRTFEQLAQRESLTAEDRFLLANLHERLGETSEAHALMQQVLRLDGRNPRYLAHQVRDHLAHGELDQAEAVMARLEAVARDSLAVAELTARLLHARGRDSEAATLLAEFARKRPKDLRAVAALLEQLRQIEAAEATYRQLVARRERPGDALELAGFLARQGRPGKALDLCEEAWKAGLPAEVVADAVVNTMRCTCDDAEAFRRADGGIEAAQKKEPGKSALKLSRAMLLTLQGRYGETEAMFREVLTREPGNAAALNNLAWLLAMRPGGRTEEARGLIDRAIAIAGPVPALRDTRALVALAGRDPRSAIADLEEAVALGPDPEFYLHLAQAHAAAGHQDEASRALAQADTLGLDEARLHPLDREPCRRLRDGLDKR
jgi:Flp pilus assembly protein TadD